MSSVLIVERHAIMAAGFEAVLVQKGLEVLNRCETLDCALKFIHDLSPALILLSNDLCGLHLATAVQSISERHDRARIILLVHSARVEFLSEVLSAGIHGILLNTCAADALLECAERVLQGRRWIDPILLDSLYGANRNNIPSSLTSREWDIASHVAQGMRNKQIAEALCVSEATIKMHLHHIYQKLRLAGRTELALAAHSIQSVSGSTGRIRIGLVSDTAT